jgi:sulfite dehydrogenase (cytochrome) subunit A
MNLTRRQWMLGAASAGASLLPIGCTGRRQSESPAGGGDTLARFPGKAAMRVINDRPPCLETPWRYFRHDLTPNEACYVRWHLQTIPTAIDLKTWRLRIDGAVDRPLELSDEADVARGVPPIQMLALVSPHRRILCVIFGSAMPRRPGQARSA